MIRIIESNIERLLYITLLLVFLAAAIGAGAAVYDAHKLSEQQRNFHDQSAMNLETIIRNQGTESQSIRIYIDCILHINPQGNLKIQEDACFNKAPIVK